MQILDLSAPHSCGLWFDSIAAATAAPKTVTDVADIFKVLKSDCATLVLVGTGDPRTLTMNVRGGSEFSGQLLEARLSAPNNQYKPPQQVLWVFNGPPPGPWPAGGQTRLVVREGPLARLGLEDTCFDPADDPWGWDPGYDPDNQEFDGGYNGLLDIAQNPIQKAWTAQLFVGGTHHGHVTHLRTSPQSSGGFHRDCVHWEKPWPLDDFEIHEQGNYQKNIFVPPTWTSRHRLRRFRSQPLVVPQSVWQQGDKAWTWSVGSRSGCVIVRPDDTQVWFDAQTSGPLGSYPFMGFPGYPGPTDMVYAPNQGDVPNTPHRWFTAPKL